MQEPFFRQAVSILSFLPANPALGLAYYLADVLLLPSRLDPLPNVAIDALSKGLPVLCFDKAAGVAELLQDSGAGADCVAPCLDTIGLARRLVELARSADRCAEIGQLGSRLVAERLQMDGYARRIVALAEAAIVQGG